MELNKLFKGRQGQPLFSEDKYSIFIPLVEVDGQEALLFEKRSSELRRQPGEISFPGGAIEEGESPEEAALRESMEELKLSKNHLDLYGEMDYLVGRDGFIIRAFVGRIKGIAWEDIQPNPQEVDHVFAVPLAYFLENPPKSYALKTQVQPQGAFPYESIPGGKNYPWTGMNERIYFYYWKEYIIWGLTAKMALGLVTMLKKEGEKGLVTKL